MQIVKIHLEIDELAPIQRLAAELKVSAEDIAYAGLDTLMLHRGEEQIRKHILNSKAGRKDNLPKWADQPREIHAYESMT